MKENSRENLINQVEALSQNLRGAYDLDPLIHLVGDAKYVLLGEASHGTSDYYLWRARISQRLICEKRFSFIAVEGDWHDSYLINRFIKGFTDSGNRAYEVLNKFNRWPSWIWANWETVAFAEWLKEHNSNRQNNVGFYGLDMYNLWESIEAVMAYLKKNEPGSLETAKRAYMCFEPYSENVESYSWLPGFAPDTCEDEVIDLLNELRSKPVMYDSDPETRFNAEQHTGILANAEKYYRTMLKSGGNAWNIRATHMADTLDNLMNFYGNDAKGIIWAHNTHVGDAHATSMADADLINLGQLVRERHEKEGVVLVGFGSYTGDVIAANSWGDPLEKMKIPEAKNTSWEDILHKSGEDDKLLILKDIGESEEFFEKRPHRAIGVVYNPEIEQYNNYVPTILPGRYDAFIYIDKTQALNPLHPEKKNIIPPETYPWGM